MKLKCPLLLNMHLKKNQQNYWSFYPSEPFKNGHFNVRHPVFVIVFKAAEQCRTQLVKKFEFVFRENIVVTNTHIQLTNSFYAFEHDFWDFCSILHLYVRCPLGYFGNSIRLCRLTIFSRGQWIHFFFRKRHNIFSGSVMEFWF